MSMRFTIQTLIQLSKIKTMIKYYSSPKAEVLVKHCSFIKYNSQLTGTDQLWRCYFLAFNIQLLCLLDQ